MIFIDSMCASKECSNKSLSSFSVCSNIFTHFVSKSGSAGSPESAIKRMPLHVAQEPSEISVNDFERIKENGEQLNTWYCDGKITVIVDLSSFTQRNLKGEIMV